MIHDSLVPDHEYTVLSLSPIAAWAVIFAGKDVDNRTWTTPRRGRVLIHASNEGLSLREGQTRRAELSFLSGIPLSALPPSFPRNAILGSAELTECSLDAASKWAVPGKFHWVLSEPKVLPTPFEVVAESTDFWRWTYGRKAQLGARSRRPPSRSGVVPALRNADIEASKATSTRKR